MVQSLRKTVCHCLKMLNAESPHNPEIPFPVMCPREMKMHLYTKTCMWVLTAVLFLIAKKWKPNAHRLRKGYKSFSFGWLSHTVDYLSALKGNEVYQYIQWHGWILKMCALKEVGFKRPQFVWFQLWTPRIHKSIDQEKQCGSCQELRGEGEWRVIANWYKNFFFSCRYDKHVLKLDVVMVAWLCEYAKKSLRCTC